MNWDFIGGYFIGLLAGWWLRKLDQWRKEAR